MATNYKHLGQLGLEQLLQLLSTEFGKKVAKEEGKGLSTNDFTNALLEKLNGIEAGANKYTHAAHTAQALGLWKVQVDDEGHVASVQAVEKADITGLGIPGQDTTYVVATQTADGLMAATDKKKLDGIAEGANKYVHAAHTEHANGFYKITVNAEGHVSGVVAVTKADLVTLLGEATMTEAGLMSDADKTKLEGIEAGAQVNKIEKILVNGEEKAIDGKSVEITVPTGSLANKSEVTESELGEDLAKKINDASAASHSHKNLPLLETYTQTEADLADAVTKKHAHTFNETELNKVQTGDVAKWNTAAQKANTNEQAIALLNKTDGTVGSVKKTVDDAIDALKLADTYAAKDHNHDDKYDAKNSAAQALKDAKEYADQQIAAQISSAYKAAGTVSFDKLPADPTAEMEGFVYNVSSDFVTDDRFIEGSGKSYKTGTNVVVIEASEDVFMFDVLAMSFNGFVQEADITEYSADEVTTLWNRVFTA